MYIYIHSNSDNQNDIRNAFVFSCGNQVLHRGICIDNMLNIPVSIIFCKKFPEPYIWHIVAIDTHCCTNKNIQSWTMIRYDKNVTCNKSFGNAFACIFHSEIDLRLRLTAYHPRRWNCSVAAWPCGAPKVYWGGSRATRIKKEPC